MLARAGHDLHLVTLEVTPYPNRAPYFSSPLEDCRIDVEDSEDSADQEFYFTLQTPFDPDYDFVTVEMITDLSKLGFISYEPIERVFKFTGLTIEHQGQYFIKFRLIDVDYFSYEAQFKL